LKVASLHDVEFNYEEKGRGRTTVVFVHGSLSDYRSWKYQFETFASRYHVVTYSRRNHFPNRWKEYPADYSIRTERDDLVEFIDATGLKTPVHIVGSSYGAFVAALVGSDYPELVRSLVLGEPPILSLLAEYSSSGGESDSGFEKKFADKVLKPLRIGDYETAAMGFIDSIEGDGSFGRLPYRTRDMMLENSRTLVAELPTSKRDHFTIDDAGKVISPTLLIKGQHTSLMYQTIVASLARSIRHATISTIGESSHTPFNTNPEVYNGVVLGFLSSH
jgi:non-heme chloroperoxidase